MDKIFKAFLQRQFQEGLELAEASDLLDLIPLPFDGLPPQRYVARFSCKGLVRTDEGVVREANHFEVGIWFPSEYLRRANPLQVLSWLGPHTAFHPNISSTMPFICIGRLVPGTALVDILYQCFEVITFNKVTMREDDALNAEACMWARHNQHRFPIDRRPLKRRRVPLSVEHSNSRSAS